MYPLSVTNIHQTYRVIIQAYRAISNIQFQSLSQFWSISTDKTRVVGAAIAGIYTVYNYHSVSVNLLGLRETFKTIFMVIGDQGNVVVSQNKIPDPLKGSVVFAWAPPPPLPLKRLSSILTISSHWHWTPYIPSLPLKSFRDDVSLFFPPWKLRYSPKNPPTSLP